jgi:hypothetical protein
LFMSEDHAACATILLPACCVQAGVEVIGLAKERRTIIVRFPGLMFIQL